MIDSQHGKHEVLGDLRDHSQKTVPQLYDVQDEKALHTVLAEHACDLQTKFEN